MTDDCCAPLLVDSLSDDEASHLADAFKALADPARVRILNLVSELGEACGCHLTGPLSLSQPTVSHHLAILHRAGLLHRQRRGKWVYYSVRPEGLNSLRGALATDRENLGRALLG